MSPWVTVAIVLMSALAGARMKSFSGRDGFRK